MADLGVALKAGFRGFGTQPTARHYRFTTLETHSSSARR
jgi:hypothetical protein